MNKSQSNVVAHPMVRLGDCRVQLGSPAYGSLPLVPFLASYHDNKAEIDG